MPFGGRVPSQPKVADLDVSFVDQHVFRLQIAVDNVLRVEVLDPNCQLHGETLRPAQVQPWTGRVELGEEVAAVNQLELSISYHDDDALAYNEAEGIRVQAYSPLCGGFAGSSCTAHGGKNVLTVPAVIAAAKTYGVSTAQIGLKWVVQRGFPLATSIWKLEYMDEDLSLWGFTITDADMKVLDAVYRPAH